jgi:hypothetical protein
MEPFKDIIETGTYVAVNFSNETNNMLFDLFSRIKKTNKNCELFPKEEYHTTLIYDVESKYIPIKPKLSNRNITISSLELKIFGENKDYLVLSFHSNELHQRHKELLNHYGLTHSYNKCRPHISIAKNVMKYNKIELPKQLSLKIENEYSTPIQ